MKTHTVDDGLVLSASKDERYADCFYSLFCLFWCIWCIHVHAFLYIYVALYSFVNFLFLLRLTSNQIASNIILSLLSSAVSRKIGHCTFFLPQSNPDHIPTRCTKEHVLTHLIYVSNANNTITTNILSKYYRHVPPIWRVLVELLFSN